MQSKVIRNIVKDLLPPAVLRLARKILFRESQIRFKGHFATWEEACAHCTGYDYPQILAKVLDSTLKVKRGDAVYERDSVLFDRIEYAWPVLAGLMLAATHHGGRLNVLDFGGSLGSSYFQNRNFLQTLPEVRWNVVEQVHYVEAGQANIQDNQLKFYSTIEDCLSENQPNVVLLSGVLQCLPNTFEIVGALSTIGAEVIILDRTVVNKGAYDRIYIQYVPEEIYKASYPCRSISEGKLIRSFGPDYKLWVSFPSLHFPALSKIGSDFAGYIFVKC